jgi:hypothetical protein
MQRVLAANASSTAPILNPADVEIGYFRSDGLGSTPGWPWFHVITEELMNILTINGVTPDVTKVNQIGLFIKSLSDAISTLNTRAAELNNIAPIGSFLFWPSTVLPTGYIKANGAILPKTGDGSFPKVTEAVASGVLSAISTDIVTLPARWAHNSTSIRVPDLRGMILKAHHDGSLAWTTNNSLTLGRYEGDSVKSHFHDYLDAYYSENANGGGSLIGSNSTDYDNRKQEEWRSTNATGSTENLVRNMSAYLLTRVF